MQLRQAARLDNGGPTNGTVRRTTEIGEDGIIVTVDQLEDYAWYHEVRVGSDDFDELDHIGNAAVARMLDDARTDWFRSIEGREPGAVCRRPPRVHLL